MNLIDAMKSGKCIRRKDAHPNEPFYEKTDFSETLTSGIVVYHFYEDDLTADWEIEEEKKQKEKTEITKQQLLDLYHLGVTHGMIQKGYNHREVYNDLYNMLTKLGHEGDL